MPASLSNSALTAPALSGLVADLADSLQKKHWLLATAESCTGGLIAAACTELAGSSAWFERGFVTYSNAAKTELLSVGAGLIAQHGAVSEEVARAMVQGAIHHARAQVAVAVTGVAGPSGGSAAKPVGTVCFGFMVDGQLSSATHRFAGERHQVRQTAVRQALQGLLALLK